VADLTDLRGLPEASCSALRSEVLLFVPVPSSQLVRLSYASLRCASSFSPGKTNPRIPSSWRQIGTNISTDQQFYSGSFKRAVRGCSVGETNSPGRLVNIERARGGGRTHQPSLSQKARANQAIPVRTTITAHQASQRYGRRGRPDGTFPSERLQPDVAIFDTRWQPSACLGQITDVAAAQEQSDRT
jgi:hypothetical protein